MTKKVYEVEIPQNEEVTPFIYIVDEEGKGLVWRDAKKKLRQWYLGQARMLRDYSEKDFKKHFEELVAASTVKEEIANVAVSSTGQQA